MEKAPVRPKDYGTLPSKTPRSTMNKLPSGVSPKENRDTSKFSKGKTH